LFPAFSSLSGLKERRLEEFYARSLKTVLLVMGPIVLLITLYASDLLSLWMGSDFAAKSSLVLQILAGGWLLNALAQMPANLLDAIGRPDLRAKIFLTYVIPYVVLLWFLIGQVGIVGAALAWTLRAALELVLFFGMSSKLIGFGYAAFVQNGLIKAVIAYGGLVGMLLVARMVFREGTLSNRMATIGSLMAFFLVTWRVVLDALDKESLLAVIGRKDKT
jgi:O-antigen/teichoic acid export membrane protein